MTFSRKVDEAYPPIFYVPKILSEGGQEFLAVIVPGSDKRPHFSGPAWVRVGSETRKANEKHYEEFIASRQSKSRLILEWKGKLVSILWIFRKLTLTSGTMQRPSEARVTDCNQFYVAFEEDQKTLSVPLTSIEIAWDCGRDRPMLEIHRG
jgi:hypothetical protein